ncbi:MAG: hypothetical protein KDK76_04120, partial [Chlamydiia bacterium]|nr:hypothetical protein [Chlamydiia bacterium]
MTRVSNHFIHHAVQPTLFLAIAYLAGSKRGIQFFPGGTTRKGLLIAAACQIGAMEAVSRLPDKYKFYSSNQDGSFRGVLYGKAIENLANAPLALLIGNIAALCLTKRPDLSFVAATQIASVHLIAAAL